MKRRTATRNPEFDDWVNERILTTRQLIDRVPLTRQSLWRMVREKRFPAPIRLTKSKLGWRWSTVLAWLNEREDHPLDRRSYFPDKDTNKPTEAA
jgi:predicted DNA-binding transcriptional regulator AlpA